MLPITGNLLSWLRVALLVKWFVSGNWVISWPTILLHLFIVSSVAVLIEFPLVQREILMQMIIQSRHSAALFLMIN